MSWEDRQRAWERRQSFSEFIRSWDDLSESDDDLTQAEARDRLCDYLLHLNTCGKLTANVACIVAHWATKAGAEGDIGRLAMGPGRSSGNHKKTH